MPQEILAMLGNGSPRPDYGNPQSLVFYRTFSPSGPTGLEGLALTPDGLDLAPEGLGLTPNGVDP